MISRILHLIGIARSTLVDDTGPFQLLQVDEGAINDGRRVIDNVRHAQHYGFASVPPIGSRIIMVRQTGDRSQSVAIASNHNDTRLRGQQPGDSALYNGVTGAKVTLTAAGVLIDAAGSQVTVRNASKVRCECDVETTGDLIARADGQRVSVAALHDAYAAHHHTGVTGGTATTGLTDKPV